MVRSNEFNATALSIKIEAESFYLDVPVGTTVEAESFYLELRP